MSDGVTRVDLLKLNGVSEVDSFSEDETLQKSAEKDAQLLFEYADGMTGATDSSEFKAILKKVNKNNIVALIKAYKKLSPNESLLEMICDETGASKKSRKMAANTLFSALEARCKELGITTDSFAEIFNADLSKQIRKWGFANTDNLDAVFDVMLKAIENKTTLSSEDKQEIASTSPVQQYDQTNKYLATRVDRAQKDLEWQLGQDGWAGDVADGISTIWGSDNRADKVRSDLKIANAQMAELEEAKKQGSDAYKAKFKEIYGVEYDAELIKVFEQKEQVYLNAKNKVAEENNFNEAFKVLLAGKDIPKEMYTSGFVAGSVIQSQVPAAQIYEREFNKVAELFGGADKLNTVVEQIGGKNISVEKKYEVLHAIVKSISKQMEDQKNTALAGKDLAELKEDYDLSFKTAFGTSNDILKRVADYNISQQKGAGMVKGAAVATATIATLASLGKGTPLLVAALASSAAAGGATALTEVSDKFTSGDALKALREQGFVDWVKKGNEMTDWGGVVKASALSSGLSLAFAGQSYAVTNLVQVGGKALGMSAAATGYTAAALNSAAFIGTGIGTEKLLTGEITVQGTTFTVLMSLVGGALQVKNIYQATKAEGAKLAADIHSARQTLGIADDIIINSQDDLQAYYRKAAWSAHPDHGGSNAQMAIVSSAKKILADNLARVNMGFPAMDAVAPKASPQAQAAPAATGNTPVASTMALTTTGNTPSWVSKMGLLSSSSYSPFSQYGIISDNAFLGSQYPVCEIPAAMKTQAGNIGGVPVKVVQGDMTAIKADAFCVPEFSHSASGGGVGYSVINNGALEGMNKYNQMASSRKYGYCNSSVVLTESGGGNSPALLHLVTASVKPDAQFDVVKYSVLKALKLAEENGLSSVAIPALGTGIIGSLTEQQSAQAIMAGIQKFAADGGKMDVALVVYGADQGFNDFVGVLQDGSYASASSQVGARQFNPAKFLDSMSKGFAPAATPSAKPVSTPTYIVTRPNGTTIDLLKGVNPNIAKAPTSEYLVMPKATTVDADFGVVVTQAKASPVEAKRIILADTVENTLRINNENGIPLKFEPNPPNGEKPYFYKDAPYGGRQKVNVDSLEVTYTKEATADWGLTAEYVAEYADKSGMCPDRAVVAAGNDPKTGIRANIADKQYEVIKPDGTRAPLVTADLKPGELVQIIKKEGVELKMAIFDKTTVSLEEEILPANKLLMIDSEGHPYNGNPVKRLRSGEVAMAFDEANPQQLQMKQTLEQIKKYDADMKAAKKAGDKAMAADLKGKADALAKEFEAQLTDFVRVHQAPKPAQPPITIPPEIPPALVDTIKNMPTSPNQLVALKFIESNPGIVLALVNERGIYANKTFFSMDDVAQILLNYSDDISSNPKKVLAIIGSAEERIRIKSPIFINRAEGFKYAFDNPLKETLKKIRK